MRACERRFARTRWADKHDKRKFRNGDLHEFIFLSTSRVAAHECGPASPKALVCTMETAADLTAPNAIQVRSGDDGTPLNKTRRHGLSVFPAPGPGSYEQPVRRHEEAETSHLTESSWL